MGEFMSRLPLGRRFVVAIGVMLLPIVIVVAVATGIIRPTVLGTLDRVTADYPGRAHRIAVLENTLLRAVTHADHYLILRKPTERERFVERCAEVDAQFDGLETQTGDAAQLRLLFNARKAWQEAKDASAPWTEDATAASPELPSERMFAFDNHVWRAVDALDELQSAAQAQVQQQINDAARLVRLGPPLLGSAFAVAVVLAILGGFALYRSVLRPIADLARSANRIGSGDLDHRVRVCLQDEIGQLGNTFNEMAQRLQEHQEELEALSLQDELTGVANYRGLVRVLEEEFNRSTRYGTPLSLLILDLDHFKVINDTYGHPAGDLVLQEVANMLKEVVRPSDFVARYGGEEFAVVLPQTDLAGALLMAERVRATVEELRVTTPAGDAIGATTSVGVAARTAQTASVEALVHAADSALYCAKRAGRNRVCQSEAATVQGEAG